MSAGTNPAVKTSSTFTLEDVCARLPAVTARYPDAELDGEQELRQSYANNARPDPYLNGDAVLDRVHPSVKHLLTRDEYNIVLACILGYAGGALISGMGNRADAWQAILEVCDISQEVLHKVWYATDAVFPLS